jgi:hypothetical protein
MARALIVVLVTCIALGACTQRLVCPAYQSAFIYDKESLRKKFSYFNEDSTPKVLTASKTKFLIAEPTSYQKKLRSLQTVEMKPIYPIVPDSLKDDYVISQAELDSAANSIIDSTYIVDVEQPEDTLLNAEDSVYVITKDREVRLLKYDTDSLKYSVVDVRLNVDQDNYMWYLRDYLVLPDVRLAKLQNESGEKNKAAKEKKEKKGFFGFFKNLFKKKKKEEPDSTILKPVKAEDDYDYVDTVQQEKPVVQEQPKKKGLFSRKKKENIDEPGLPADNDAAVTPEQPRKKKKAKKKKKEEDVPAEESTPEETEEKDDGF